jgi:serine/threonine protein kinase
MNANGETAAEQLVGRTLSGGWNVTERLLQSPTATGGNFSVGYRVSQPSGDQGFLKAIDFERVMLTWKGVDVPRALQAMTESYNFERDVLKTCRDLRLSRVATAVDDGFLEVAGFEPLHQVYYLIFELAERDARAHLDSALSLEAIWCLRTLQHVATGIRQLHSNGIAHQDLKPSNVFEYGASGSRVGDFGRASRRGSTAPHDGLEVAGDKGYAPPELLYGLVAPDWTVRRFGCDAYLLGSLTYFFFSRASVTAAVMARMHPGHSHLSWTGSFTDVLPFLRDAFDEVLREFSAEISISLGPMIAPDVVNIVRELCEPDPTLRGSPLQRSSSTTQFSMERYITRFDVLAGRAAVHGLN